MVAEFYSIVPAHAAAEFMGGVTPLTSDQSLIYRASDVDLLGGPEFCTVLDGGRSSDKATTGLEQYKALIRELPRRAATSEAVATRELEVAVIADFEFFSAEADPADALLDRLNVVDGIFSEQVGVAIAPIEVKVFDTPADPFTAAAAPELLDEVGRYRVATPTVASAGLAHLVTGRDLIGNTVGIAYLFGVCLAEIGVSVSERLDLLTSALVMAHEFGHNFGAPHDGDPDHDCRSTPPDFLMAPTVNNSRQFSQCSLDQMAPVVAEASCLRLRQYVDVAVELEQSTYAGHTRTPLPVQFDVANIGTRAADNIVAEIDLPFSVTPSSISAEGGTCTVSAEDVSCRFGSIARGERRRVRFDVTASVPGDRSVIVLVTADEDVDTNSNRRSIALQIRAAADASLVAEPPQAPTVLSGSEFEISYRVDAEGIQPLDRVAVHTTATGHLILAATADSGKCTVRDAIADCDLGGMAAGSSRRVTLRLRARDAGRRRISHTLAASPDDNSSNDRATHDVWVNPLVDLVVQADLNRLQLQVGETFTRRFTVSSLGPREAGQAAFSVDWDDMLEVTTITAHDATCAIEPGLRSYRCPFGSAIESGGSRLVDVTFRAAGVGVGSIRASVFSPDNQHVTGPLSTRVQIPFDVRDSADVRIRATGHMRGADSRPFDMHWEVASIGLDSAQGASVVLSLPPGMRALSARPNAGSCALAASSVRCELGTIEPGGSRSVTFSVEADHPGSFEVIAEAGATNDANASNNVDKAVVDVARNVDVRIVAPPRTERLKVGQTFAYTIEVLTASHPVTNVHARIEGDDLDIELISISQGSCTQAIALECELGTVPADSSVQIVLDLTVPEQGSASISLATGGDMEFDTANNGDSETFDVRPVGNARIEIGPLATAPRVDEAFESPEITVRALEATEAVHIRVSVPPELSIVSVAQHSGPCSVSDATVECDFGDLQSSESRSTFMRLRATRAGSFTLSAEVVPLDDSDTSDNSASVTVTVDAAASAPSPQPPPAGGGGSLDWTSLLLGALGLALRSRRRPPASIGRDRQLHSVRCPDGPASC